jgi:hypothetical protein
MVEISPEAANFLMRLLNSLTIRQIANEIALRELGLTEQQWSQAFEKAVGSVGWAVLPESNPRTMAAALEQFLKKLPAPKA